MKKFLSIILLFAMAFSASVTIKGKGISVRDCQFFSKSKVIGVLEAGEAREILETYSDFVEVEAISGTDNVGKRGYIYSQMLDGDTVKEPGVILRSGPSKNSERICSFKTGSKVKIIKNPVIWVRITEGWIYAPLCDIK